ncbi:unnamed protein product [Tenebrio molitor]|nr:unnamed protein product [Tenebrio molitor]
MKAKERRKAPEITPRLLLRSYLLQDNAAAVRTPASPATGLRGAAFRRIYDVPTPYITCSHLQQS